MMTVYEAVFPYLPETPTQEQQDHAKTSPLYRKGDMRLIWVNEMDLWPRLVHCWKCGTTRRYTTGEYGAPATRACEECSP